MLWNSQTPSRLEPRRVAWWAGGRLVSAAIVSLIVGAVVLVVGTGELAPGLLVVLVVAAAVSAPTLIGRRTTDLAFGQALFLSAFAVRTWAGIVVWLVAPHLGHNPWLWFPDGLAFDQMAQRLALDLLGQPVTIEQHGLGRAIFANDSAYVNLYSRTAGLAYALIGYQPLFPIALNWLWGALAPLLIFAATRRLASVRVACWTAVAAAFWPSAVLWSLFNLRESAIVLLLALAVWAVPNIAWRSSAGAAAIVAPTFVVLERLRFYVGLPTAWLAALTVLLASLLSRTLRNTLLAGIVSVAVLLGPWAFGGGTGGLRWAFPTDPGNLPDRGFSVFPQSGPTATSIAFATRTPQAAPSAAASEPQSSSGAGALASRSQPGGGPPQAQAVAPVVPHGNGALEDIVGTVLYRRAVLATYYSAEGNRTLFVNRFEATNCLSSACVPAVLWLGVTHVLFAPLPWDASAVQDLLVLPEVAMWVAVVALALAGMWGNRTMWREWLFAAVLTSAVVTILALVDVNSGTVFRHRAMLLPGMLVLAAQGLESLLKVRQQRARV